MLDLAAIRKRYEAIIRARQADSLLVTDDPKLTLKHLALTDLPAVVEALEEAQGKLAAMQELHAFDCTIDQACLVSRDDVDRILKEGE